MVSWHRCQVNSQRVDGLSLETSLETFPKWLFSHSEAILIYFESILYSFTVGVTVVN